LAASWRPIEAVVDQEQRHTGLGATLDESLGDRLAAAAGKRAAHRSVGEDALPGHEDEISPSTGKQVEQLLVERPSVRVSIAEP
jgi:hypothetical protein